MFGSGQPLGEWGTECMGSQAWSNDESLNSNTKGSEQQKSNTSMHQAITDLLNKKIWQKFKSRLMYHMKNSNAVPWKRRVSPKRPTAEKEVLKKKWTRKIGVQGRLTPLGVLFLREAPRHPSYERPLGQLWFGAPFSGRVGEGRGAKHTAEPWSGCYLGGHLGVNFKVWKYN